MAAAPSHAVQVLTFSAGGRTLAVRADAIAEVAARPVITPVPGAPAALRGVVNLRSGLAPVNALGAQADGGARGRLVVVRTPDLLGLATDGDVRLAIGDIDGDVVRVGDTRIDLLNMDAVLGTLPQLSHERRAVRNKTERSETTSAEAQRAFLSVSVAGETYAFPLETVSAVLKEPQIAGVASADLAVLGVIEHNSAALPLVSLAALLGLRRSAGADFGVVLSVDEGEVAVAVDHVASVVRVTGAAVTPPPALLNRKGEAKIDAILRTQGGLIATLDPLRLFDGNLRALCPQAQHRGELVEAAANPSTPFLLFRLGDQSFGLPAAEVVTILRRPARLPQLPGAPPLIAGVIEHLGRSAPVVDCRRSDAQGHVILARADDASIGLLVDAAQSVVAFAPGDLTALPDQARSESVIFDRVAVGRHGEEVTLLVNLSLQCRQAAKALANVRHTRRTR